MKRDKIIAAQDGDTTKKWPEQIPDTPENVARACMQGPPKKRWRYLEDGARAPVED